MVFSPIPQVPLPFLPMARSVPEFRENPWIMWWAFLKAYSTCVGAGPFVAEKAMSDAWEEELRKAGGEYGAATGRPRSGTV